MKEREAEGYPQERKGICLSLEEHGGFHPVSSQDKEKGWMKRSWGGKESPLSLWALSQGQWEANTWAGSRGAIGSDFSFDRFTLAIIRIAREQDRRWGDHLGRCCNHHGQRMRPGAVERGAVGGPVCRETCDPGLALGWHFIPVFLLPNQKGCLIYIYLCKVAVLQIVAEIAALPTFPTFWVAGHAALEGWSWSCLFCFVFWDFCLVNDRALCWLGFTRLALHLLFGHRCTAWVTWPQVSRVFWTLGISSKWADFPLGSLNSTG